MAEIGLRAAVRRLEHLTLTSIGYERLLRAVLAGTVPATLCGSRWLIDEANLPKIAELFQTRDASRVVRAARRAA